MAWTKAEVDALIEAQMAAEPQTAPLTTNTSQAARWRELRNIASRIWLLLEETWLRYQAEVETVAAQAEAGVAAWYIEQMLAFQYGYVVTVDPTTYQVGYTTIDEAARIIKYVAVDEGDGESLIKVAKTGPAPLTTAELIAAQTYLRRIQFLGSQIDLVSLPADLLRLEAQIFYDGLADLATVQAAVEAAVTAYIASLNFAGQFRRHALVDAIQAVAAVQDIDINVLEAFSLNAYTPIDRAFIPVSGYFQVDPAYPLGTTLTYQAI